jgi:glycosyltransferase involved in cell wall biosynthesis
MLGYLSRMCPEKGLHHLVAAFLKLRHDGFVPDPILCIVGACTKADEPFVETMKKRIHDAGFSVDVQWHPNVVHEEKQRLLKELDVFCVPGPSDESFGLYVLEAMASGVPLLAPEHAAFPEIIGETGGGVLYDPESPEGLTSALEEILSTPEGAQDMGVKGRASVQQVFSSSEMSQRFSDILGSLSLEEPEEAPTL